MSNKLSTQPLDTRTSQLLQAVDACVESRALLVQTRGTLATLDVNSLSPDEAKVRKAADLLGQAPLGQLRDSTDRTASLFLTLYPRDAERLVENAQDRGMMIWEYALQALATLAFIDDQRAAGAAFLVRRRGGPLREVVFPTLKDG